MRGTLPAGIQGPFFNDEFGDVYGVIYALESDGFNYAELKTFADDVRQQLLRVPDVSKVELFGVQDEKVFIEISQKRLAQLGLDLNQVLAQLGQQNAVEAAGAVQTPLDVVQVRVAGQFEVIEQLRAMAEVEAVVIENNVTDFVLGKAKVTEKAISFDDLMGQN